MKHLLTIATLMTLSLSAFAQNKDAKSDSDKLDLKKLEDKYWAAKDTDFSVVQNRLYTKAGRAYLNLDWGNIVNDAYSQGHITNFEAGYYFSERWGASLNYESFDLRNNDSTDAFITQYAATPDYNRTKNYTGASLIWVPFYAKMSFMDSKILYFDMQFAAGVGNRTYTIARDTGDIDKTTLGYHFDFSQHLFFSNHWALRLDLKNEWASEERQHFKTNSSLGALSNNTLNDTSLLLGVTFFFGSSGNGADK